MPIHNLGRASAAMPIGPDPTDWDPTGSNPTRPNRLTGEAPAPTGTLHLLAPAQPSSVALVVAAADAAPGPCWSLLADPMKRIAGYLSLRDRIALSRASHAVRDALGQLAATTLERARQVSTLSALSGMLDRIDAMADVGDRMLVLRALARRTSCLARAHRLRAWRLVLRASDALPVAARGAVLVELASVPDVARTPEPLRHDSVREVHVPDCLAMLDQRLNGLPGPGRAALTFALLEVRAPQRGGGVYLKPPPRRPFDLAGHLALAALLPAGRHRDAARLAVEYHLRSPGTPAELWRDGFGAACAAGHRTISAWTLVALLEARTVEGPPLLSALEAPQLAWQQAFAQAGRCTGEAAAELAVGLMRCLRAGWAADPFRRQGIDALWQLGVDLRFDIDQRARLFARWGGWLSAQQWEALCDELMERCATEGTTRSRRDWLDRLFDTAPPGARSMPRQRAFTDTQRKTSDAAAPLERAASLAQRLEAAPGEPPPTEMQNFLDALMAAMPLADDGRAVLAQAMQRLCDTSEPFSAKMVALAADLPSWTGEMELAAQPALALEFARLAIVVQWQSEQGRDHIHSADAMVLRNFVDVLTRSVRRLPIEVRQTVLLDLGQGPTEQYEGLSSINASTDWILSVAASLPPAFRVDVLRQWAEADTRRNAVATMWHQASGGEYGWAPRRAVWRAIMQIPPEYQASLLCATTDWFHSVVSSTPSAASRKDDDFVAAGAQWLEALQRLPPDDRLEPQSLVMPQVAVMMEDAVARLICRFDRA